MTPSPTRSIAAGALALAGLLLAAAPAAAQEAAGTLKSVRGPVRIVAGAEARAAVPGAPLQPGDRLETGAGAQAGLALADGTLLAVGPDSRLQLQRFAYDPTTREGSLWLELAQGSMRMVSGLLARANPASVRVTTPTSAIGLRGTDVIVQADGQAAR